MQEELHAKKDNGRDLGDAFISQGMPALASKPLKLGERHETDSRSPQKEPTPLTP